MTKYNLKIESSFNENEIAKAVKIFNCDLPQEYIFNENFGCSPSLVGVGEVGDNFISHTIINLNVENASVKFIGRYKAEKSLCDISCKVNHNASNTKSDINIKGIAKAGGKIISRSDIVVTGVSPRRGDSSHSEQGGLKNVIGNENVKFIFVMGESPSLVGVGEVGEIDAVPSLDINSNDVSVNHSLSISKIKEADIWYSGLHGLSEEEAKKEFEENFLK